MAGGRLSKSVESVRRQCLYYGNYGQRHFAFGIGVEDGRGAKVRDLWCIGIVLLID